MGKPRKEILRRAALVLFLALLSLSVSACYTRLTTAKETREWTATYPELAEGLPVHLDNARDRMGNTIIMPVEVYMDAYRRFARVASSDGSVEIPTGLEQYRFKPWTKLTIKLPGHPDASANGTYIVKPEGTIDVGYVTDFHVAGKSVKQVREELAQELAKYYRAYPFGDDRPPVVTINLPVFEDSADPIAVDAGQAYLMTLRGSAGATGSGGSSSQSSSGGGKIGLSGRDTLLTVMAQEYSGGSDWNEIAVYRKISSIRSVDGVEEPFEYVLVILVDFEKLLYEDPNLDFQIKDQDVIFIHAERNPLIVEIVETARMISSVYGAFQGAEFVFEDIFGRDF